MLNFSSFQKELHSKANPQKAKLLQGFFKTKKGEYGEGDIFLGVIVPETRLLAKKYIDLKFPDIQKLLQSKIHEERLAGLLILVQQYEKGSESQRKAIYDFYLKNARYINNWDLVDLTAPNIIGKYLLDKPRKILYELTRSKNLWERRIAVLATFMFIKEQQFEDAFKIAEILLNDKHDLIHKAVGWMLREVGKRSETSEEVFLKKHYQKMPRTMLRYAIERFPEKKRLMYLKGGI